MTFQNFKFEVDSDGIALVTFDVPGRSMNTLTNAVFREIGEIVAKVKSDAAIKGAVITSGKSSGFCAGADLGEMGGNVPKGDLKAGFDRVYALNRAFRDLETCGKPMAAAINGLALGGGFELTLACHYRVVADNPKIQLGLPESKVGLLPGAGGTQRLPRLIGAMQALQLILEGKSMSPAEAKAAGAVHEVVPADQIVSAAKSWIKTKGDPVAPWDKKDFKLPGGGPYTPSGSQVFVMGTAMVHKQSFGNYPAQRYIMSAVYEGLQVGIESALRIESRYFAKLMTEPAAMNMVRSLFISMQELNKLARRPAGQKETDCRKLGVIGAGMMGAGIAYVSAQAGIEVVLLDSTEEAAAKGKQHSADLLDKQISRGRIKAEQKSAILDRIVPTTDYAKLAGADLVIEAVFENREVKAEVTKKAESVIPASAVFGSNTSTIPITGLAEASRRAESFVGIHFFSPVDKMQLVEIILGAKTDPHALSVAMDYVKKIKKTPIVVNDSRGFYTSRCFGTYVSEGIEMLAEGIHPVIIENVGRMTGMPRGPLELNDDVALDLSWKIREQMAKDLGDKYQATAADGLIRKMVVELGRYGRKNGKGFYDYPKEGRKSLWPGLAELAPPKVTEAEPDFVAELKKRFLYRQALEAARCFEEKVVTDPRDADVGAILGWGFAPWSGGPLSIIDSVGAKTFVEDCDRMAAAYGPRFRPNALLRDMAGKGETFYGRFNPAKKAAAE